MQFLTGLVLAIGVAWAAFRARSLNRSGALAAASVGTVIFGIGGWQWAVLLLAFFITSSMLSRLFKKQKAGLDEKFSKGYERDAGQVYGNGAVATVFAALHGIYPGSPIPWIAFSAALAAVNADTWATELGVLNPSLPRLITKLNHPVDKGTSGGVSPGGTMAALLGAGFIGALAVLISPYQGAELQEWTLITLAGLAGSLSDSFLGATIQAIYFCPSCQKETERHPMHNCGTQTRHLRGWTWMGNDWVNFACSAVGAILVIIVII